MNNLHIKSAVNNAKGTLKEEVGHATGNSSLEAEGIAVRLDAECIRFEPRDGKVVVGAGRFSIENQLDAWIVEPGERSAGRSCRARVARYGFTR